MRKYTKAINLWLNWLLQKIPCKNKWIVKKWFVWFIDYEQQDKRKAIVNTEVFPNEIEVPIWFITDLWTIPGIGRLLIRADKFIAFILHDYILSREFRKLHPYLLKLTYSEHRAICDRILLEALDVEKAKVWEKILIYSWIRIFAYWIFVCNYFIKMKNGTRIK